MTLRRKIRSLVFALSHFRRPVAAHDYLDRDKAPLTCQGIIELVESTLASDDGQEKLSRSIEDRGGLARLKFARQISCRSNGQLLARASRGRAFAHALFATPRVSGYSELALRFFDGGGAIVVGNVYPPRPSLPVHLGRA